MRGYLKNSMKGKILSVIAGVYEVYLENKERVKFTPRGKFRYLKIKPSVGDNVEVNDSQIVDIFPRINKLIRPSIANIDLGIIVVSMVKPEYSSYLLDKFLSMLKMYEIKPLIVLSKVDLLTSRDELNKIIEEYNNIGIKAIAFSKRTNEGVDEIKKEIAFKTIAFTGQTGVGKSSLLNAIYPDAARAIGEYSNALNRGKHQTKEVIIYPFGDGFIADTPGFSSLELDCYKEELKDYFPFFQNVKYTCFFQDCAHINEPKCEIIKLVNEGVIPLEHYNNYKAIYDELIFRKDRFK